MNISIIVAAALNNAIGLNNQMLWHLPNDFKFFKNKTWGLPVIMGRKTFESLGKALTGRLNIVITRDEAYKDRNITVVHSLSEALAKAAEHQYNEVMVIGGGEIYAQALPLTKTVYLTRVQTTIDGDTYFPQLDQKNWELNFSECFEPDAKHQFGYCFETWERK